RITARRKFVGESHLSDYCGISAVAVLNRVIIVNNDTRRVIATYATRDPGHNKARPRLLGRLRLDVVQRAVRSWIVNASLGCGRARLRQLKWDRAYGQEQKQIKRASGKMRFDIGIKLLFHFGVVVVRMLILLRCKTTIFKMGTRFSAADPKTSRLFLFLSEI